jgi:hypothetical protein
MKRRHRPKHDSEQITEVRTRDGTYFREIDTVVLDKLYVDQLSIADTAARRRPDYVPPSTYGVGTNPYSGSNIGQEKKLRNRSGLDYMRALSEEIKRRRRAKGEE